MDENEKLQSLLKDEAFVERLLKMTPEEVQKALEEEGVHFTVEEINQAGEAIKAIAENDGELTEEALENVAGGGKLGKKVGSFVLGMVVGGIVVTGATLIALMTW